ncbi:PDZ domain-containing protein [Jeotgalibacillus sp. S-D1]|uniref:S1C family serine protease n=1 Tax=Jeotgalibacillus sp. S-D1 TaxID=2552189 RepID=UPI00105AA870|nr:trypsin-like peptidase domain-containing protein [Jeotgalibacillus sp. S-D1]TDL32026.1 PDZ domain-containing protein [Jeotgalibacillus sp. S-D1]
MGYYDDHQEREPKHKKGSKAGYFLSSLTGLIVGALLVVLALPLLDDYGVTPSNSGTMNSSDTNETAQTEQISYDVSSDVTQAVDRAGDAVVGITNIQSGGGSVFGQSEESQEAGTGSGVIYKKEGDNAFIVTNHHVIEGAEQVEVTLADGSKLEAKVLGSDIWTDLAVLQVDGKSIETVAEFGDSKALKPGEPVIAIGNPLGLQFSGSVTTGVVSGVERTIPVDVNKDGAPDWQSEVIQTDAAINPGNSGGALVNIQGQLIGINSMKIAESSVEGIGLAIPIDMATPVIEDLETKGEVERPTMGVTLIDLANVPAVAQQEQLKLPEEVKTGVVIERVVPDSPAATAGLEDMDVVVEMDGEKINSMIELRQHLYTEKNVGDNMQVKVYRNGEMQEFTLTLTDDAQL